MRGHGSLGGGTPALPRDLPRLEPVLSQSGKRELNLVFTFANFMDTSHNLSPCSIGWLSREKDSAGFVQTPPLRLLKEHGGDQAVPQKDQNQRSQKFTEEWRNHFSPLQTDLDLLSQKSCA
jgi:hypothetical protein